MNLLAEKLQALESTFGTTPALNIDLAHVFRSKIVGKCAEAERHVLQLLASVGITTQARAPLSQKAEALRKHVTEGMSPLRSHKIRPLLDRLAALSDFRSQLVHSTMSIAEVEGEKVILLRNAAEHEEAQGQRTILTLSCLRSRHLELSRIANSLKQEAQRDPMKAGLPLSRE